MFLHFIIICCWQLKSEQTSGWLYTWRTSWLLNQWEDLHIVLTGTNDQSMVRNGRFDSTMEAQGTLHLCGMWDSCYLGRFLVLWGLYLSWCGENVGDQQTLVELALSDHLHGHSNTLGLPFHGRMLQSSEGDLKVHKTQTQIIYHLSFFSEEELPVVYIWKCIWTERQEGLEICAHLC